MAEPGIKLDQPDVLLPWGASEEEIAAILQTPDHGVNEIAAPILGYPATHLILNFHPEYRKPHFDPKTLWLFYVSGLPDQDLANDYAETQRRLQNLLGPPTEMIPLDFVHFPKHSKCIWDLPYVFVRHSMMAAWDIPNQRLYFRRKYLPEQELIHRNNVAEGKINEH